METDRSAGSERHRQALINLLLFHEVPPDEIVKTILEATTQEELTALARLAVIDEVAATVAAGLRERDAR
jgi:hypothetical protein